MIQNSSNNSAKEELTMAVLFDKDVDYHEHNIVLTNEIRKKVLRNHILKPDYFYNVMNTFFTVSDSFNYNINSNSYETCISINWNDNSSPVSYKVDKITETMNMAITNAINHEDKTLKEVLTDEEYQSLKDMRIPLNSFYECQVFNDNTYMILI